ncbi:MAG: glycosyltransferase [Candidatus Dadabacteria bacterium]|nr:glycosyltransferase [Candidatus Dadabacteria bacterium]
MEIKNKIKILHVNYSLGMGGAERVIVNYARFLDKNKFDVVVCALTEGGEYENDLNTYGIKYYALNKKRGFDITVIPKIFRIIRSEKIDIVHLHDISSSLWVTLPAILSGVHSIIRTEHNVKRLNINFLSNMKNYISFFMSIFQKKIVCVSEEVRKTHIGKNALFNDKYITIHNGINTELFDVQVDREKYLREFDIEEKSIIVCNIGRFFPQKAHEIFLQSIQYVLEKNNDVAALIVGDGPRREELEELARKLEIFERVNFTGNRSDVPQILNLIDIFALSSDWEGFPMTILEAMACGKPVVVTDVGGNREAIIDGDTGYIVPPRNPRAMSEAILSLINDKRLRVSMGVKGRKLVLHNFNARVMVRKTELIYEKLMNIKTE